MTIDRTIVLIVGLILAIFSTSALAASEFELDCVPAPDSPNQPTDPIVEVRVSYKNGLWSVAHIFASGRAYYRERQYFITDTSSDNVRSWKGISRKQNYIEMRAVAGIRGNEYAYKETVYDMSQGGVQTGLTLSLCQRLPTQAVPVVAQTPAPACVDSFASAAKGCSGVTEAAERLACYDRILGVELPHALSCPSRPLSPDPTTLPTPKPDPAPTTATAPATTTEATFVEAVQRAANEYKSAANEMQQGGARASRRSAICDSLPTLHVSDWRGKILQLSSNGDGWGVLSVQIAPHISLSTTNNSFSDTREHTLINPSTPLFKSASSLAKGDEVAFSGQFIEDNIDCTMERSLTLDGSLTEPDFVFQFSDVRKF